MIQVGWVTGPNEMHLIPLDDTAPDHEAALAFSGHEKHRECMCYPRKVQGSGGWEEWTMWVHREEAPVFTEEGRPYGPNDPKFQ